MHTISLLEYLSPELFCSLWWYSSINLYTIWVVIVWISFAYTKPDRCWPFPRNSVRRIPTFHLAMCHSSFCPAVINIQVTEHLSAQWRVGFVSAASNLLHYNEIKLFSFLCGHSRRKTACCRMGPEESGNTAPTGRLGRVVEDLRSTALCSAPYL